MRIRTHHLDYPHILVIPQLQETYQKMPIHVERDLQKRPTKVTSTCSLADTAVQERKDLHLFELLCGAVWCSVVQYGIMWCNVVQCDAA